jgi:hypothetical protein
MNTLIKNLSKIFQKVFLYAIDISFRWVSKSGQNKNDFLHDRCLVCELDHIARYRYCLRVHRVFFFFSVLFFVIVGSSIIDSIFSTNNDNDLI